MKRTLTLDRSERPGTFYIDEEPSSSGKGLAKIVITFFDGTQHVDYPVQYINGSFGFDFPERVPAEVRRELKSRFTISGD